MLHRNMRSTITSICLALCCMGNASVSAQQATSKITNERIQKDENRLLQLHGSAFTSKRDFILSQSKIQLQDFTWWRISPKDVKVVANWINSDILLLKPARSSWFSREQTLEYPFVLKNHQTQETVRVVLSYSPDPDEGYSRYIIDMNSRTKVVQLNDGTFWKLNLKNIPYEWKKGHVVIVGLSQKWRSKDAPYILINVGLEDTPYSEASLVDN